MPKKSFRSRPPVVSILGHIDHGKTTLLDQIRKTNITASEAGGITQHIGAYQVEFKGRKITLIDTPGHAAFAKMRARGAKATDLAILVVAGDEGVKPQTKESLEFIKKAKIPFLVAINKIDLPRSDIKKVTGELAKIGVLVEKKGGKIVVVPISAKKGKGIDDLLEMVLLMGEMEDLKADPSGAFQGVVIESKLDRNRGPLATVLVKNGTLFVGDVVWAEGVRAKVKAMYDENSNRVTEAFPSKPVGILGFGSVPPIGASVTSLEIEPEKKENNEKKSLKEESGLAEKSDEKEDSQKNEKKLKLILKADTRGTLEAIRLNFPQETEVIFQDVGDINESDVLLAQTVRARLIGFNVRIPAGVKKLAQIEKVRIRTYQIIYELLEEVEKWVTGILKPSVNEEILGEAKILKEFSANKKKVAGCRVLKGRIAQGDRLHLKREEKVLADCRVASLKKGKLDVKKAKVEEEFGVVFSPQLDFVPGDVLISFRKLPKKK